MGKPFIACGVCLALSACINTVDIESEAKDEQLPNRQAQASTTLPVEIIAFFGTNPRIGIAGITELRGAECILRGSGFATNVSPPQIFNLPLIDGKPVDVTVSGKDVLGASEL